MDKETEDYINKVIDRIHNNDKYCKGPGNPYWDSKKCMDGIKIGISLSLITIAPELATYGYSYASTFSLPTWIKPATELTGIGLSTIGIITNQVNCNRGDLKACEALQDIGAWAFAGYTIATWNNIPSTYTPKYDKFEKYLTPETVMDDLPLITDDYLKNVQRAPYGFHGNLGEAVPILDDPRIILKLGSSSDIANEVETLKRFGGPTSTGYSLLPKFYGSLDDQTYAMERIWGIPINYSRSAGITISQKNYLDAYRAYDNLLRQGFTNADFRPAVQGTPGSFGNILVTAEGQIKFVDPYGAPSIGVISEVAIQASLKTFLDTISPFISP